MLIQSFRRWIGDKGPSGSLDAILNIQQPTVQFFLQDFCTTVRTQLGNFDVLLGNLKIQTII